MPLTMINQSKSAENECSMMIPRQDNSMINQED